MSNNHENNQKPGSLSDSDWDRLIQRIKLGKCTPFLGAGANSNLLPQGAQIASDWATDYSFPLRDSHDLARVALFLALTEERALPKELMQTMLQQMMGDLFKAGSATNLVAPHHPLGILGALPLPVYITTNYDDVMYRALKANRKRAQVEICTWTEHLKSKGAVNYPDLDHYPSGVPPPEDFTFSKSRFKSEYPLKPTADSPVVYHLHGHYSLLESMVLTENDYLDFLVQHSKDDAMLPSQISTALTSSSLLFMGYSLADPNFRVLFRGLIHPLAETRRLSVAIQLRPQDLAQPDEERALHFLEKYFGDLQIKVFWGTAEEFAAELWRRY
jgi:hypothetical protein